MNNNLFSKIKDRLILVLEKRKKMSRMIQNIYRKRQTNLLTRMISWCVILVQLVEENNRNDYQIISKYPKELFLQSFVGN